MRYRRGNTDTKERKHELSVLGEGGRKRKARGRLGIVYWDTRSLGIVVELKKTRKITITCTKGGGGGKNVLKDQKKRGACIKGKLESPRPCTKDRRGTPLGKEIKCLVKTGRGRGPGERRE